MDGDRTRRHRPTGWVAFGVPKALLTGDALLVLAFDLVAGGVSEATLRATVLELIAGQSDDLHFAGRIDVKLPYGLRMAEQKTGALFGAACELGALSVSDNPQLVGLYRQFGRHLGTAFQLTDDFLGIWGCESAMGKPVYSDVRSKKNSLPVVAALTPGTAAGQELALLYDRTAPLYDDDLLHAASLIEAAGGRAWAEAEAAHHRSIALDILAAAQPDPDAAADLRGLADLIAAQVS